MADRTAPLAVPIGEQLTEGDPQAGARALILVVERDGHVRALEKYFLEEAGFAVEFADDGRSALDRAVAVCPRILIS